MYKLLFKREMQNIKILCNIAKKHGYKVFFWSFADGICRRLHLSKVYQKTHYLRHEACKNYLRKTYSYIIEKYKTCNIEAASKVGEDSPIWRYWHQGFNNLPYPVNITLGSLENNAAKHPLRVLDENTYKNYIHVPDYIENKFKNEQMNIAVFSDYIRLALLKQYGGIWLDSTFYVNEVIPEEINNSLFYTINHGNRRDWVVTRDRWSVGLLACGPNNPLVCFCEEFLREYWKNETMPIAYLMTDCIIALGYEEIPAIAKLIDDVPINNIHCFDFLTEIRNQRCDKAMVDSMKDDTFIFQLTYKIKWNILNKENEKTNFGELISSNNLTN